MAEIIKLDEEKIPAGLVDRVKRILDSGGLIVYPTTTLYGLGAGIFSDKGIEKLVKVKGRPKGMPISVFTLREKITDICDIPVWGIKILDSGLALTFVLQAKPNVPSVLTQDGTLAVRFPDNRLVEDICKAAGPITATSANRHGGPEPLEIKIALDELGEDVDLYLDAGKTDFGKGTTIVDMTGTEVKIIREGIIPTERVIDLYG
ncbi:MAG: threonylcarbamoyl-AMP synthase [Thermoplasmata archaeon]|nr:threonylcarbamoyl-AMP synthase [Thermoplasmata archaeon]